MKQFLVLLAVLPLLLVFLLQFSLDQINHARIGLLSDCVYVAKEQARQAGCFTDEICESLRSRIAGVLDIDPAAVSIEATDEPVYRRSGTHGETAYDPLRGLIYYKISVPVGPVMAGARLFGIKEKENLLVFNVDSATVSERLSQ